MKRRSVLLQKPKALRKGARLAVVSPSSPAEPAAVAAGVAELRRLGYEVEELPPLPPQGYFAGRHEELIKVFRKAFHDKSVDGVIATRGGYGANYLVDLRLGTSLFGPKCLVGYSDLTVIQVLLYQVHSWTGFYGPMVAAGFNHGANQPSGYDEGTFLQVVRETKSNWSIPLRGESMATGSATGHIVGGCLTMLQTTLGTGWEPDTQEAILVLEDRGMKPYQVDRVLRHLW